MKNKHFDLNEFYNKHVLEVTLIIIVILLSIMKPIFLKPNNLLNIVQFVSLQGFIAWGMTVVLICGEIDLSVFAMVGLTSAIIGVVCQAHSALGISLDFAAVLGIIIGLIFALLFGAANAFFMTRYKMPSFIVTLSMSFVIQGLGGAISGGYPITSLPGWFIKISNTRVLGVSTCIILFAIFFVIFNLMLNNMQVGRSIYAIGGNLEAARLSGINVAKYKYITMMAVQVCGAAAGVMMTSQSMSGTYNFGATWMLTPIAGVIIGGTSLTGGAGNIWGTLIGILFLGVINNAFTLLNINTFIQNIAQGLLILIAFLINIIQAQRKMRVKAPKV